MSAAVAIWIVLLCFCNESVGGRSEIKGVQVLNGSPYVRLQHGLYFGKTIPAHSPGGKGYHAFLGIRYAASTERFEKSVPMSILETMTLPLLAQTLGPSCPQIAQDGFTLIGKEDCLFGNVYVPTNDPIDADGFPVIVFIHPGTFKTGSGGDFDVSYFMNQNVICATFNFRLGALGFLSTQDENLPGNLGLKDQVTFLEWIKDNIDQFGGSKKRVVIAGIESGAASVQYLLLSELSKGLFQAAIMHGGSVEPTFLHKPSVFTKQFSDELECPHRPSQLLVECLKIKRLKDLLLAQKSVTERFYPFSSPFLPSPDYCNRVKPCSESFLSKPPSTLLAERHYKRVPLLIGMNSIHAANSNNVPNLHSEFQGIVGTNAFSSWLLSVLDRIPSLASGNVTSGTGSNNGAKYFMDIQQLYFNESIQKSNDGKLTIHNKSLRNFLHDILVVSGIRKFALTYAHDKPVYPYIITLKGNVSNDINRPFPDGMEFLSPSSTHSHEFQRGSDEDIFSQHLVQLWTTFAIHQKPVDVWQSKETWMPLSATQLNGDKPITWYALNKETHIMPDPFSHKIKLWDKTFQ